MTSFSTSQWQWLDSPPAPAAQNMAVDQALLETAAISGTPVVRFYRWTEPAATFGYFQKFGEVEGMTHLRPLVRRPTGGGVVPHDADWTYSAIFPPATPWYGFKAVESYRRIHEWLQMAFQKMGIPTELAPCCKIAGPGQCFIGYEQHDLLWHGKKIAGAAQRRTRDGLLIQGSVQPPPGKLARHEWEQAMRETAVSTHGVTWKEFPNDAPFQAKADRLAREVYGQREYNLRR